MPQLRSEKGVMAKKADRERDWRGNTPKILVLSVWDGFVH